MSVASVSTILRSPSRHAPAAFALSIRTIHGAALRRPCFSSRPIAGSMSPHIPWTQFSTQQGSESSSADAGDTPGENVDGDDNTADEEVNPLEAKISTMEAEMKDLRDQALRALADAENARSIARRDVTNAKQYAVTSFAKALLDVADNLALATASVSEEELSKAENSQTRTLMEGVQMTEASMKKTFGQFGLQKYGERGDLFDPNLHDALYQLVDEDLETGTIGQVLKPGYKLNDRVVRPAQVGTVRDA